MTAPPVAARPRTTVSILRMWSRRRRLTRTRAAVGRPARCVSVGRVDAAHGWTGRPGVSALRRPASPRGPHLRLMGCLRQLDRRVRERLHKWRAAGHEIRARHVIHDNVWTHANVFDVRRGWKLRSRYHDPSVHQPFGNRARALCERGAVELNIVATRP